MRLVELSGEGRVATAIAISRFGFRRGAERAVLASAASFADALAAAPLAGRLGGPLLLTDRRLGPALREEFARLGARHVVVVGAVAAVPAVVQADLEEDGLAVTRIAGESRYDTAALVAGELATELTGEPGGAEEVAVTTGDTFADALSFAPLAAADGLPVLLTTPDRLPQDSASALEAVGARRCLVLGGTEAVGQEVVDALPSPRRVAGVDRYATSVRVAELLLEREGTLHTVGLATGADFPDGLAAGPVLGRERAPLLLVDGQDPEGAPATFAFLEEHASRIERALVFGGERAISPAVRARVAALDREAA